MQTQTDFVRHVAEIWLAIGIGGVLFRTVHLFFLKDVQTGLVWATKILTDPFHDIKLYHKAPLALLRGELIDPGHLRRVGRGRSRRGAAPDVRPISAHSRVGGNPVMKMGDEPGPRFRIITRKCCPLGAYLPLRLMRHGKQTAGDHFFEDRPFDRFVGQRRIAPPPAVLLHGSGRGDKAIRDRRRNRRRCN